MAIIKGSIALFEQLAAVLLNFTSGKIYGEYLLMQLSDWLSVAPGSALTVENQTGSWLNQRFSGNTSWALAPASSWWKRVTWCLAGAAHRMIFLLPSFIMQAFLVLTKSKKMDCVCVRHAPTENTSRINDRVVSTIQECCEFFQSTCK